MAFTFSANHLVMNKLAQPINSRCRQRPRCRYTLYTPRRRKAPFCCAPLLQSCTSTSSPPSLRIAAKAPEPALWERQRHNSFSVQITCDATLCSAPAKQMALPFFRNLPQKVIVSRMPVLRHLRNAVEVKGVPLFVLIYFPIFR